MSSIDPEEEEEGDGDGGFAAGDSLFHRSRARYRMFADAIATNFGVDDLEPDFFADMWRKECRGNDMSSMIKGVG